MTTIDHLIEQHFLEHEARLKHVDELLEKARQASESDAPETSEQVSGFTQQREEIARSVEELRSRPLAEWQEKSIEEAGPMAVWDALAIQLENFLERHGK